jgi:hypothetical protein
MVWSFGHEQDSGSSCRVLLEERIGAATGRLDVQEPGIVAACTGAGFFLKCKEAGGEVAHGEKRVGSHGEKLTGKREACSAKGLLRSAGGVGCEEAAE